MQKIFISAPFRGNTFTLIDHGNRFLAMHLLGGAR